MPKINILVEGITEEVFVKQVLDPYINHRFNATSISAVVLATKIDRDGKKWRGGLNNYAKFRSDAKKLLADRGASLLTCMIDLHALPHDFPGYHEAAGLPFRSKVSLRLFDDLANDRFLPYISTHEFEALLLSNPRLLSEIVGGTADQLTSFMNRLPNGCSPETINSDLHPSSRILQAFPQFDKVRHGATFAEKARLDEIRRSCEHFNQWISHIEPNCQ